MVRGQEEGVARTGREPGFVLSQQDHVMTATNATRPSAYMRGRVQLTRTIAIRPSVITTSSILVCSEHVQNYMRFD